MKNSNIYLVILYLILASGIFTACQEETIIDEPEVVYDQGERWILHDNLIVLENSAMTHGGGQAGISFDPSTGAMKFDADNELGVAFELDSACVLNVDMGDDVIVRVVTSVISQTVNTYYKPNLELLPMFLKTSRFPSLLHQSLAWHKCRPKI